ncbi:uncharacterized protein Dwil_GK27112 [Drosophila willistoni]|uniref:Peptidase S1 domain-containing protein n=1 Tax=Drosophila willistoni TaxID=7260 RepID=A0A0Q9WP99_DROWI|nr:uncharacterized protein Dwil_GK27112 [Drosophila willistoni]
MKTLLAFLVFVVALARGHHDNIDRTQELKRGFNIPDDIPDLFGRVHDFPEYIIYNGYEAAEGSAPYIVSLETHNGTHTFVCGGSIIGDNWILTAAHCLTNRISAKIFYGSNYYGKSEISHTVGKENLIYHELFNPSISFSFDIGLIRTPRIEFTDKISKIALIHFIDGDDKLVGLNTKSCGWGYFRGTVRPERLQCMNVNVISNEECDKRHIVSIYDDMLCTGRIDGKAVCDGDSGGPLVTLSNPPILVGVNTFNERFCDGDSGYARVSFYLKWIQQITGIVN